MSKKKIVLIAVSAILALLILGGLLAHYVLSGRDKVSYDINVWSDLERSFTYLPSVEEMGEFCDLESKYLHRDHFIFQSNAYILKATYSKEIFDRQKDIFLKSYSFQETVVDYGEEITEKDASFTFDGFRFQMLSLKEYNLYYPKQIVFIGVSEKNNEIAFVFFDDIDLDYISDSFEEFLVEECGWE